jgi:hemoglobin
VGDGGVAGAATNPVVTPVTLRSSESGEATLRTFYDEVGGAPTFAALAHEFYKGIAGDPVLHPMYPEEDLGPAEDRLRMFLEQYFGGPTTYSDTRGHPRLRMRHMPFAVNPDARDRWLRHMTAAVDTLGLPLLQRETMLDYFDRAAHAMVNTFAE